MITRPIKFFICTRDRHQLVERCVAAICRAVQLAFPYVVAEIFIFDDCTSITESVKLREITNRNLDNLKINIIGPQQQEIFFRHLVGLNNEYMTLLRSSCKQLGTGEWDLAGVRNFAFLYAFTFADEEDLIIFLDDDILFEDAVYQGHYIPIDGATVLRNLYNATPAGKLVACGTGYWGCADVSILQHLIRVYRHLTGLISASINDTVESDEIMRVLKDIGQFPHNLPIQLQLPNQETIEEMGNGEGGISGAVLAVTPTSLLSHGLARFYNEDWIWLALLGSSNDVVNRVRTNVIHAAPTRSMITVQFLVYQEVGEIVYSSIKTAMRTAPDSCDKIAWCRTSLNNQHFSKAKESELEDIYGCLDLIVDAKSMLTKSKYINHRGVYQAISGIDQSQHFLEQTAMQIRLKSMKELYDEVLSYLNRAYLWRGALESAGMKIKGFECLSN